MRRYLLILAAAVLTACSSAQGNRTEAPAPPPSSPVSTSVPQALTSVHDPGHVTGTLHGPCSTRDSGQLPDPNCTPGSADPSVTAQELCNPTYTTSYYRPPESETSHFKWNVAEPAYGQHSVSGELDHLVSLELGGSNDATNLWVEAGPIPNAKDRVENALHAWVCAAMPDAAAAEQRLHQAQISIATNWLTALASLHINP